MAYLTNLADIARSAGLKVVEVSGWKTRGHGDTDVIKTIVCHHTAGSTAKQDPRPMGSLNTITYGRTGLTGPLANYGLGRDGTVYVVAAGLAYHAGQVRDVDFANAFSIGIEAQNAGTSADPWPAKQLDAYARLCAALVMHFKLDVGDVLGHKEVCYPPGRKIDPSLNMDDLRRKVRQYLASFREPLHAPAPSVPGDVTLHRILQYRPLRRVHGEDVKAVQRKVGAKPDGDFGRATRARVIAYQKAHRLKPDGVVGANTAHAMGFGWVPR